MGPEICFLPGQRKLWKDLSDIDYFYSNNRDLLYLCSAVVSSHFMCSIMSGLIVLHFIWDFHGILHLPYFTPEFLVNF